MSLLQSHPLNKRRFIVAASSVFIMTFVFDYLVHHILLRPLYEQTASLWREMSDMTALMPWVVAHQLLISGVLAFLFTLNFEGKGWMEGVRFGLVVGTLLAFLQTMAFAWLPVPLTLPLAWGAAQLLHAVLAGIIMALLYRR